MKTLIVGREAEIIKGILQGYKGKVVAFDSHDDEALVQLDNYTYVQLSSEDIIQEGDNVQLSFEFEELKELETPIDRSSVVPEEDWDSFFD